MNQYIIEKMDIVKLIKLRQKIKQRVTQLDNCHGNERDYAFDCLSRIERVIGKKAVLALECGYDV